MHSKSADILMSLKPKHIGNILAGEKTVELRRRRLRVEPGTIVWLYATAPVSALYGCARIQEIVAASPLEIWNKFNKRTAISKAEFDEYFVGSDAAYALLLTEIKVLRYPLGLQQIKRLVSGFHPPQFFCHLNGASAKMRLRSRKYRQVCN